MAAPMPVGPTRIRLPDPSLLDVTKPEELATYLRTLNSALAMALAQRPAVTSPTAQTLLLAPDGSVYSIKVDNAGTLATELERGPHAPPP